MTAPKERLCGPDIVRFFAICFVVFVHGAGEMGIYKMNMQGTETFLFLCFRWLCYSCVPLFMVLTGYFQYRKQLNWRFYKGILPILASYGFISILAIAFRIWYWKEELSWFQWLCTIFDFTGDWYSWYVEMFIGLFLLIPFLNILYHGLPGKREKQLLIGILLFLTALPSLVSTFSAGGRMLDILPDYWLDIYPISYYYIGAYLREYPIRLNRWLTAGLLAGVILLVSGIGWHYFAGGPFIWEIFNGYYGITTVAITVLVFLLFYQGEIHWKPLRWLVTDVASLSFDMYLFSFIFDKWFYSLWLQGHPMQLRGMLVVAPAVLVASYLASCGKRLLFRGVTALWKFTQKTKADVV
ncbi:MAG: acyltransferase [Eubacteriales bacterium]|jgi:surface polysaccharide O-acyltransferase-like enzyme